MDRYNFRGTGGFPMETDVLDGMQRNYNLLNAVCKIAGEKVILKDCTADNKGNVSDGVVYVSGEVFEFRGGPKQPTVVIEQDITSRAFEDGQEQPVLYKRYVTFGSGGDAMNWTEFKRYRLIEEVAGLKADVKDGFTELKGELTDVNTKLAGKAPLQHNHDDRYYTQDQTDGFFEAIRDGREAIGLEDLAAINPELDLLYFSAVKNGVGCVSITLQGVLTTYDSTYGFTHLLTLPEGFQPYGFVAPVSCHVSLACDRGNWFQFPYESRTVSIAVDGYVQLYDYERDPNTQGRHISFSTNYMISQT